MSFTRVAWTVRQSTKNRTAVRGLGSLDYVDDIRYFAKQFGVSPSTIAAVIQMEGQGRQSFAPLIRFLEDRGWAGSTIGIGQMLPDVPNRLVMKYWGISESVDVTRGRLINSDHDAIALVAAYLDELQDDYGLSCREAAIAYAFDSSGIDKLRGTNWSERAAVYRGNQFDRTRRLVNESGLFR